MSELSIEKRNEGNKLKVALRGEINEDSDFSALSEVGEELVEFDFEEVSSINSCGVREWIKMLEALSGSSKVVYRNPRKLVVMQFNQVQGFIRSNTEIENFYAPYFCESCDEEKEVLLKAEKLMSSAPEVKCEKCGKEMEFDALEDQYFLFLNIQS